MLLLRKARALGISLLVDADGLKLVARQPGLVRGYARAVLTPNAVEFERMARSLGLAEEESGREGSEGAPPLRFGAAALAGPSSPSSPSSPDSPLDAVAALALSLEGPVVLRKGAGDCMAVSVPSGAAAAAAAAAAGTTSAGAGAAPSPSVVVFSACCSRSGSPRRAGGQGDLTSGSVAAFLAWACSRRLAGGGEGEEEKEEEASGKGAAPSLLRRRSRRRSGAARSSAAPPLRPSRGGAGPRWRATCWTRSRARRELLLPGGLTFELRVEGRNVAGKKKLNFCLSFRFCFYFNFCLLKNLSLWQNLVFPRGTSKEGNSTGFSFFSLGGGGGERWPNIKKSR